MNKRKNIWTVLFSSLTLIGIIIGIFTDGFQVWDRFNIGKYFHKNSMADTPKHDSDSNKDTEFVNNINSEPLEYYTPTHILYLDKDKIVEIRNRPLSDDEIYEAKIQSQTGIVIDANTIIGYISGCSKLRILKDTTTALQIKYWNGKKAIVGFIPRETPIRKIVPLLDNDYGIGNGKLVIGRRLGKGICRIYIDDKYISDLSNSFKGKIDCESNDAGIAHYILEAGEHSVRIDIENLNVVQSFHITINEGECYIHEMTL